MSWLIKLIEEMINSINSLKLVLEKINIGLSFLYLLGIVLIIFFAWGYGDDYFILNRVRNKSIFESMIYFYNNWDGRQLSPGGFFHFFSFKYLSINLGIGLIFISWIVFLFYTLKILKFNFSSLDFLSISALFLIGLFPFYKDILFWKTGGFYVFFLIQATTIIWLFHKKILKNKYLEFFVIVLLALNSINIIFPILFYFLLLSLYRFVFIRGEFDFRIIYFLLAIISGIALVSISPGNSIRLKHEAVIFLPIVDALRGFPSILYKALNYSKYSFVLGILSGFVLNYQSKYSNKKIFLLGTLIFSLSIISVFPFLFTPSLARIRVFFSVATFLFFSGCFFGFLLKSKSVILFNNVFNLIAILCGLFLLFGQIKVIVPHSRLIKKREVFLESKYNSQIDLSYFEIKSPDNLLIIRSPDYDIEWNQELVNYYRLKSFKEK